jgi:hypothetical protein
MPGDGSAGGRGQRPGGDQRSGSEFFPRMIAGFRRPYSAALRAGKDSPVNVTFATLSLLTTDL